MPAFTTLPWVAEVIRLVATCCGDHAAFAPSTSAAAPATCGVAMEVPLMTAVPESLVYPAEVMSEPGANRSTQVPWLE